MSAELLIATRDFIKSHVTIHGYKMSNPLWCEITLDGKPMPSSGEFFISVHDGGTSNGDCNFEVLDMISAIQITTTLRCARIPSDKIDSIITVDLQNGIIPISWRLAKYIHMNYEIMIAANKLIGEAENGYVEPLRFSSISPPRYESANWFGGGQRTGVGDIGVVQTITFNTARNVKFGTYQPVVVF